MSVASAVIVDAVSDVTARHGAMAGRFAMNNTQPEGIREVAATPTGLRIKRTFSPQFKREIAIQVLAGSRTVRSISEEYAITTNLLYKWSREHRAGKFGPPEGYNLIGAMATNPLATVKQVADGYVELRLAKGTVVLTGSPDPNLIRNIVAALQ